MITAAHLFVTSRYGFVDIVEIIWMVNYLLVLYGITSFYYHVIIYLFVQRLKTRYFRHNHISQITKLFFLTIIHRVHRYVLPVICENLLVLTRVRCGQRGAALGVVSFIGGDVGNHL